MRLRIMPIATPTKRIPTKACIGTEGLPSTKIAERKSPMSTPLTAPERAAFA